jgi:serine/threonine protein kinase, bacterial
MPLDGASFRLTASASSGCVATGAALVDQNHQEATGGAADVLRFIDGHWQDTPSLGDPAQCPGVTNRTVTDNETARDPWSLGTLGP